MSDALPFALPDVGDDEIAAVIDAIRTGWVSSGPKVKEFESAFGQFLGGEVEAVALNSATAGLHLALEAIGLGPGDEVLIPTWTFTATAEVVRYLGADPILVDVDPSTLCLDLDRASAQVTTRTKAVIPVHFAGRAMDMRKVAAWARGHNLAVVEDAAHAFPARSDGQLVGTNDTQATVFSFYATKTMTTGEGGMLVTRDPAIAARARVMRLHGIDRDAFGRYRSEVPAWQYDVVAPGFKCNLGDPAAALGLIQLERVEAMRARREEIAQRYLSALESLPLELPSQVPAGDLHAWHLFVVRMLGEAPIDRDELIERLFSAGIGTSVHFIPLHLLSYWRDTYRLDPADFPVATREFARVISLPIYSAMSDAAVERVIQTLLKVLV